MTPQTTSIISNEINTNEMTSKTYKIDFERKIIVEKIDRYEALKQAVYCILNTIRYKHIIYSFNYGSEIQNAIGMDYELAKSEIERYVKEAILADDRFTEIRNFKTEKIDSDSMLITFDVYTAYGTINVEQEVGV